MEWEVEQHDTWPVKYVSSNVEHILGYSPVEMLDPGFSYPALIHPDDIDAFMALNGHAFKEKTPFSAETRIFAVDNEVRWIVAESTPRTLPDRTAVCEGVVTDITDRKHAEEALGESLKRFNDLISYVTVGVLVFWFRANGLMEFEYVSHGWCEMNQIRREELMENSTLAWDIIHPDDMESFIQLNRQVVRDSSSIV